MQEMCFFSRTGRCVVDAMREDGRAWITGQTFEEVRQRYPDVERMTLDDAVTTLETMCIDKVATRIDKEQFIDALECMPPNKWRRHGETESFMSPEHLSGRVTSIYVRIGKAFYTFHDVHTLSHDDIVRKALTTPT